MAVPHHVRCPSFPLTRAPGRRAAALCKEGGLRPSGSPRASAPQGLVHSICASPVLGRLWVGPCGTQTLVSGSSGVGVWGAVVLWSQDSFLLG